MLQVNEEKKSYWWVWLIIVGIIVIWWGYNWYHTRISQYTPQSGSYECPFNKPVKGNAQSGIYHVPGGASYERTMPERCFSTEEDAINAGYRASKR